MEGIIRLIFFGGGIVFLFLTRRKWLHNLLAPLTWGGWLLASGWAVLPLAMFFAGFALEKGRMYSAHGLVVILSVLIGLWILSGWPTLFFGVFKSIKSRIVRQGYARIGGYKYFPKSKGRIGKSFIPPSTRAFISNRFSNLLEINPGLYIAGAVRSRRLKGLRGSDYVVVEGISVPLSVAAIRATRGEERGGVKTGTDALTGIRGIVDQSKIWGGENPYLVIVSQSLREIRKDSAEPSAGLSAGKETVQTILQRVLQHGPEQLTQVEGLFIHQGRIILELGGFIVAEDQLEAWVACTKSLNDWSPTATD
ncbi:MAG: hypothetical protein AB1585_16045 [Thermodesulfobacteriota bacterium]